MLSKPNYLCFSYSILLVINSTLLFFEILLLQEQYFDTAYMIQSVLNSSTTIQPTMHYILTNISDNYSLVYLSKLLHLYSIIKTCCYRTSIHNLNGSAEAKYVSWNGRRPAAIKSTTTSCDIGGSKFANQRSASVKNSLTTKEWQQPSEASSSTNTINCERKE